MNGIEPVVRHMILCDDVRRHASNPNNIDIVGVISAVRPAAGSAYPLLLPRLTVYLHLTGGRGTGTSHIDVRHADSDLLVSSTALHTLTFSGDPLGAFGVRFRLKNCPFPQPGLYWVQFWYNQKVLAEQSLLAK